MGTGSGGYRIQFAAQTPSDARAVSDTLSASGDAQALEKLLARFPAVIIADEATETGGLEAAFRARHVACRVERLGAANVGLRRQLHQHTGWRKYPQVFIRGRFVGGYGEALRHPVLAADPTPETSSSLALWVLGLGGLVPFVAAAVTSWADSSLVGLKPSWLSLAYGACILSFLGGVQWGGLVNRAGGGARLPLALSVGPALIAWCALLLGPTTGLPALAVGFLLAHLVDEWHHRRDLLPRTYLSLRRVLTPTVLGLVTLTWLASPAG